MMIDMQKDTPEKIPRILTFFSIFLIFEEVVVLIGTLPLFFPSIFPLWEPSKHFTTTSYGMPTYRLIAIHAALAIPVAVGILLRKRISLYGLCILMIFGLQDYIGSMMIYKIFFIEPTSIFLLFFFITAYKYRRFLR